MKCAETNTCKNFTIVGSGIEFKGGKYVGKDRNTAAKKAGTALFQRLSNPSKYKNGSVFEKYGDKKSIKFILRESTAGSNNKTTAYEVKRTKLSTPKVVEIKGVKITYQYKYETTPLKSSLEQAEKDIVKEQR